MARRKTTAPPRDNPAKATQAEVELRVQTIYPLLLNGVSRRNILRHVADLGWDLSERSIDYYIQAAEEIIVENGKVMAESQFALAVTRLNDLYGEAIKQHKDDPTKRRDPHFALTIQKELNALFGLYAAQKVDAGEWRTKAIADISQGLIAYEALAQAFDDQTARELFTLAGKAHDIPT